MANPGFAFANPQPTLDKFDEFDPQEVAADSGINEIQAMEVVPAPWKTPPVMSLSDVLNASTVQAIPNAG